MKFIATGDWHIGARMGSAGAAAPRFREARFAAAERIVHLAAAEGAGALFLLGDTFDGDGVGAVDIQRTLDILAQAPCQVFVLPGNHDWWHEGGALASFARLAEEVDNVSVLTELETPLTVDALPGVTFFPCPVRKHAEVGDPTRWIPARAADDGARIGLIHGGLDQAEWGGRVPERVAEKRDLDLALLGDWHKPVDGPDGRTFYPGSPEPGGFGDEHTGQAIVATIDVEGAGEGDRAGIRRVEVGRLAWHRIALHLESSEIDGVGPSALEEALEALPTPRRDSALRIRLTGELTLTELDALDEILAAQQPNQQSAPTGSQPETPDEAQDRAQWATCDVHNDVMPLGEPDLDLFEEPAIRAVAERIWQGDADPALRRRALTILAAKVEATR